MAKVSKKVAEKPAEVSEPVAPRKNSRKIAPVVAIADVGEKMLEQIVAATLDETKGFIYTSPAIHGSLVEAGLVEVNPNMTNTVGDIATRATDKGVQTVNAAVQSEVKPVEAVVQFNGFEIKRGFSALGLPAAKRGRAAAPLYPFDSLEVDCYFFVPNSEDKPNAAKSLASTVTSANARFAVEKKDEAGNVLTRTTRKGNTIPVVEKTREFVVRAGELEGVKGAFVVRVA